MDGDDLAGRSQVSVNGSLTIDLPTIFFADSILCVEENKIVGRERGKVRTAENVVSLSRRCRAVKKKQNIVKSSQ